MDAQCAERLELLLREFDRLGIGRQIDFDKLHLYSIITHSTAIEGSTVTLEENAIMFDDGILPAGRQLHEQMMNLDLKKAYDVARELAVARTDLTLALLKALSSLVMRNTGARYNTMQGTYDESKGDLRLQNVSAGRGGRSYLSWEKVETRTVEFIAWLNSRLSHIDDLSSAEVYDLSFETHYRLVTIHPWSDGNGRVARLLMNLVQMEGGVVPSIVRNERKAHYLSSLQESQEQGSSAPFLLFMADETLNVLAQMIDEYKLSIMQDVPWADTDITPVTLDRTPQVAPQVTPQVKSLIVALGKDQLTATELRARLGLSDAKNFRALYLRPALDAGLVTMTIPDKPRSRNQHYQLTTQGLAVL